MPRARSIDLANLVSDAGDGAVAMELDGRIVLWNDAASALLGHRRSEVMGRRCWEVLAGCDAHGTRICHEDCDVMRRARARQPVAWFDMRSPARAGRSVSLGVTTLSTQPGASGRRLITHLLCDLTKFAERTGAASSSAAVTTPAPGAPSLTRRELEVLSLTREGGTMRAIAERLRVSPATVRNHTQSILRKLDAHSRLEAVACATRHHLFPVSGPAVPPHAAPPIRMARGETRGTGQRSRRS